MTLQEGVALVLAHLRTHGKAKNSTLRALLGGDAALLAAVREDVIFEGLAEDVSGAGLRLRTGVDGAEKPGGDEARGGDAVSGAGSAPDGDAVAPKRLFISYGHADAADLAFRLRDQLRADGHEVWIDEDRMRRGPSSEWEGQIEEAIDRADVVIAVLSPHAVRRPDGVCLDEIALARYTSTPILPVMARMCQPPLGIYRLNWLDFQHADGPGAFETALAKLRRALATEAYRYTEGTYAELVGALQPRDFGREIAGLTRHFTGRAWVRAAVEGWLADPDGSPVFLLTGDPGTGKSAALAWLAGQIPNVAALHLCRATDAATLDPVAFVKSLAAQLASQLGTTDDVLRAYAQAQGKEPGTLFNRLVADPLFHADTQAHGPVLVLVDGLDEAARRAGETIPQLLGQYLSEARNDPTLASKVRFLFSTRKVPAVLNQFSSPHLFELEADRAENRVDLQVYLANRLAEPRLRAQIAKAGTTTEEVAGWIEAKAAGNFLYAEQAVAYVAAMREPHHYATLSADTFPLGLVGLYQQFFARLFPTREAYQAVRPLLDVLVAAYEPLTARQLAAALGANSDDVVAALASLAAFFPKSDGRYRPYHASVLDWLADAEGTRHAFRAHVTKGHATLADATLRAWETDGAYADAYAVRYLAAHLLAAERWDALVAVIQDFPYLQARVDAGEVVSLGDDLAAAARWLPARNAERAVLRVLGRAIRHDVAFLVRHPESLFQQCWNRGWWWDAREAARHLTVRDEVPRAISLRGADIDRRCRPSWSAGAMTMPKRLGSAAYVPRPIYTGATTECYAPTKARY